MYNGILYKRLGFLVVLIVYIEVFFRLCFFFEVVYFLILFKRVKEIKKRGYCFFYGSNYSIKIIVERLVFLGCREIIFRLNI